MNEFAVGNDKSCRYFCMNSPLLGKDNYCFSLSAYNGRMIDLEKKKKEKRKRNLSSMQEVTYSREFKRADQAGGFVTREIK